MNVLPFDKESGLTGNIQHRDITISRSKPLDDDGKMEFISVNRNGTATIKLVLSGEILTTKPMGYFRSERYGSRGLRLISILEEKEDAMIDILALMRQYQVENDLIEPDDSEGHERGENSDHHHEH